MEYKIQPNNSWIKLDLKSLYEYRDLLFLLVRRDFVSKYKQTILGPAWAIIQPILSTFGFLIIKLVLDTDTGEAPAFLFFMCGQLGWSYYAATLASTGNTLRGNAGMFSKVYFPRLISPLSSVATGYIAFGIQFVSFLAIFSFYIFQGKIDFEPTLFLLMLPVFAIQMGAAALGCGLWLTSLSAKYRDVAMIQGFLVNLLMFATPILWPFSRVPENWQWLAALNPMAMIVEGFKTSFLNMDGFSWGFYTISLAITLIVLLTGIIVFQRTERTFVDTV